MNIYLKYLIMHIAFIPLHIGLLFGIASGIVSTPNDTSKLEIYLSIIIYSLAVALIPNWIMFKSNKSKVFISAFLFFFSMNFLIYVLILLAVYLENAHFI